MKNVLALGEDGINKKSCTKAYAAGIIVGNGKGNIYPNNIITRQEAAVILAKAFDLPVPTTDKASSYSDSKKFPVTPEMLLIQCWREDTSLGNLETV